MALPQPHSADGLRTRPRRNHRFRRGRILKPLNADSVDSSRGRIGIIERLVRRIKNRAVGVEGQRYQPGVCADKKGVIKNSQSVHGQQSRRRVQAARGHRTRSVQSPPRQSARLVVPPSTTVRQRRQNQRPSNRLLQQVEKPEQKCCLIDGDRQPGRDTGRGINGAHQNVPAITNHRTHFLAGKTVYLKARFETARARRTQAQPFSPPMNSREPASPSSVAEGDTIDRCEYSLLWWSKDILENAGRSARHKNRESPCEVSPRMRKGGYAAKAPRWSSCTGWSPGAKRKCAASAGRHPVRPGVRPRRPRRKASRLCH